MKTAICKNGEVKEGDRVCSFDLDGEIVCGILKENKGYPEVSEWYVLYDDGFEGAVLDMNYIFKHPNQ